MTRSKLPLAAFLAAVLLGGSVIPNASAGSGTTGYVNLLIGVKLLGDTWLTEKQRSGQLDLTWGARNWPVLVNTYVGGSWGKGENAFGDVVDEASYETGIGLARLWNVRSIHPHVAAGIGHVSKRTHIEGGGESGERRFEDADTRLWVAGGGFWRLGSGLNLGVAARFSGLGHTDATLGGSHLGLTLGWGWPASP